MKMRMCYQTIIYMKLVPYRDKVPIVSFKHYLPFSTSINNRICEMDAANLQQLQMIKMLTGI